MTEKLRILLTINTSWNIVNFRASLIRALQAEGYYVITAAPEDSFTPRLMELSDEHHRLTMHNAGTSPLHDFNLCRQYYRLMKQLQPKAVLAYTIKPNVYGSFAAGMLGIPIINNVSGLGTVFIKRNWLTSIAKWLYRSAFKYSTKVYFQNQTDRALFVDSKLVKPNKTKVIAGSGIDLDYFSPKHNQQRDADAPLKFILVARMLWDKGIGEYVDAARLVKQHCPEAQFSLLGPTDVQNNTAIARKTITGWEEEGVIRYLGESDDVRSIIAKQDCVVLPSYREGMSRVLLESAAMGKPLIASDVPGCREVVDHGINGYLAELRNVDALAKAMQSMIEASEETRLAMGAASRSKAEEEFDEQKVIQTYLDDLSASISP